MSTPERLWGVLEAVPGLSLPLMEWKSRLGPEFPSLEPFLRLTGEYASSYPCRDPARPGCTHKVVEHGPDDLVGVCPEGCAPVRLRKSDILIHEVDLSRLGAMLAATLGVGTQQEPVVGLPTTLRLGAYSPTAGYRYPVYLTMQMEQEGFGHVVEKLTAGHDGPFILLAPTQNLRSSETDALLQKKQSCFLALSDILRPGADGQLEMPAPPDSILEAFREAVLPRHPDTSGMIFFETPSGATWEEVSIQFFRDWHRASVHCGAAQGVYHYSHMGMANSRNGNPTKQWETLRKFAENHGVLHWGSSGASPFNKKRKQRLSADLRRFFRIEGDPFEYDRRLGCWRSRFAISPP